MRSAITRLGLTRTALPADGDQSIVGRHAHAYGQVDGRRVDFTGVDPSMAGSAGGAALVTTVQDPRGSSMRCSRAACSATATP